MRPMAHTSVRCTGNVRAFERIARLSAKSGVLSVNTRGGTLEKTIMPRERSLPPASKPIDVPELSFRGGSNGWG